MAESTGNPPTQQLSILLPSPISQVMVLFRVLYTTEMCGQGGHITPYSTPFPCFDNAVDDGGFRRRHQYCLMCPSHHGLMLMALVI
mmetsp:Transcript_6236/g.9726  ORF Transcript_6236/g.9726 Transcript_6236/m.9726 type:complete len:86 (+) Transcript_6236:1063-1320(+)